MPESRGGLRIQPTHITIQRGLFKDQLDIPSHKVKCIKVFGTDSKVGFEFTYLNEVETESFETKHVNYDDAKYLWSMLEMQKYLARWHGDPLNQNRGPGNEALETSTWVTEHS